MNDFRSLHLDEIRRDLFLRGYSGTEVNELLDFPILLIPGPVTPLDLDEPIQQLTNHIAFLSKDLSSEGVTNVVAVRRDVPKHYVEERHAHVDLGTIVVSLISLQQLDGFANIAQILDFFLNLMKLRFSEGRTTDLTPSVTFDLQVHNGDKVVSWHVEGPANDLIKMTTPARIAAITAGLKETSKDDYTRCSDT
ncbi:MAG: hypothetical protein WA040_19835 [Anaerolineae bacterium]